MSDRVGCGGVPQISYSTFAGRIGDRVSRERVPLEGSIELTFRCNLRCAHCYVSETSGDRRAKRQELATADLLRITDEAADLGCLWMLLTGGEVLLRPDSTEIYLRMKKRGLLVSLFTNGTLITPRVADLLAEYPPLVVEITIYGSTPAVYERITAIPDSFRRCLRGIELLLDRKVHLRLKTIPMALNYTDMGQMRTLAAGYGLDLEWDPLVNCRVDGNGRTTAVRLSPEQIVVLEKQDPKRVSHYQKTFRDKESVELQPNLFACGAYLYSFHIDPYGNLFPCMLVRWPAYSLREGSFCQGWHEFFPAMRNRRRTKSLPCDACQFNAVCDHCVGWAQLETGDPEGKVEFLCDLANARAEAFGPQSQSLLEIRGG